jgi:excisionase family DNA binding protein
VNLLTPQEAAKLLKVSERTLRRLKLPRVKLGKQYRYRPADIDGFINLHLEYPEIGGHNVSRIQRKPKKVGLQVLPSRAMLQAIRLGQQNGGETGGAGSAS